MNDSAIFDFPPAMTVAAKRSPRLQPGISATVVPIGPQGFPPVVVRSRIMNHSATGAKLCCDVPLACDRLWLAFTAERRLIVEAEIVWSDFASAGPDEIIYGVRFHRVLSESEFSRLIDALTWQHDDPEDLMPSIREQEESLFALFRGHAPQGARSRSVS